MWNRFSSTKDLMMGQRAPVALAGSCAKFVGALLPGPTERPFILLRLLRCTSLGTVLIDQSTNDPYVRSGSVGHPYHPISSEPSWTLRKLSEPGARGTDFWNECLWPIEIFWGTGAL